MDILIKLDCELEDRMEFFRHQGALLASVKVYKDYVTTGKVLLGIEPEKFAEQWIKYGMDAVDKEYEDLILTYFVKILQAACNE